MTPKENQRRQKQKQEAYHSSKEGQESNQKRVKNRKLRMNKKYEVIDIDGNKLEV